MCTYAAICRSWGLWLVEESFRSYTSAQCTKLSNRLQHRFDVPLVRGDMHFKESCRLPGSTYPTNQCLSTTAETEGFRDLPSNPYTSCQLAAVSDQTTIPFSSVGPFYIPANGSTPWVRNVL